MGRVLQKKKNRSSRPKAKSRSRSALKNGKKKINVLGNAIIAENWDKRLTLTQNYRRLGLLHRLNAPAGGIEKRSAAEVTASEPGNSLHINGSAKATTKLGFKEARVERDPETRNILRVVQEDDEIEIAGRKHRRSNPLNDPLNDLSDNEDLRLRRLKSTIVPQLEYRAFQERKIITNKKPRHQSKKEEEWIMRLVDRYGDDVTAMARDRKLNPMQQSEGDLRRRIRKWKQNHA